MGLEYHYPDTTISHTSQYTNPSLMSDLIYKPLPKAPRVFQRPVTTTPPSAKSAHGVRNFSYPTALREIVIPSPLQYLDGDDRYGSYKSLPPTPTTASSSIPEQDASPSARYTTIDRKNILPTPATSSLRVASEHLPSEPPVYRLTRSHGSRRSLRNFFSRTLPAEGYDGPINQGQALPGESWTVADE
jgi:hypothetical protein